MAMDVSVIIVNFNTLKITAECIRSVYKYLTEHTFEVILIDNGSEEGGINELTHLWSEIRLITLTENVGFGTANNIAMKTAVGDFFLLLNSDTYLIDESINSFIRSAKESDKNVGCFGCTVLNPDGSLQKSWYKYFKPNIFSSIRRLYYANPITNYLNKSESNSTVINRIGGLYGAVVLLKREVFNECKGFDPDFFMYSEDIDWFRNRIGKRFDTLIIEDCKIVHIGGASSKQSMSRQEVVSYFLYNYKMGYLNYLIYTIGTFINTIFTLLMIPFMSKIEKSRNADNVKNIFSSLYYIFVEIPRYSNKFGSRTSPLKINKELKK